MENLYDKLKNGFDIFDEGKNIKEIYGADNWWIDYDGTIWCRIDNKQHQILGDDIQIIAKTKKDEDDIHYGKK